MFLPHFSLLSIAAMLTSGATLTITPPLISTCVSGLGVATLTWSGATGSPQINVGQPTGIPLTGVLGPSGSAVTGLWVTDGMSFYLVDRSGAVEASATAQVKCGAPPVVDQGLASGSYFPLAVGNTWVYKYNSRFLTASYIVETISGQQSIAGQSYYTLTQTSPGPSVTIALLRSDSNRVIYQYTNGTDQVYLDPNSAAAANYSGALGVFTDAIKQIAQGLIQTTSTYARGIGLVNSNSTMLSGSSGGFTQSLDLVDVRVDGFHLSIPAPNIALSIDNPSPDLTHQLASNCAVPCYFVACALVPGTDPPNTYRPCRQVRVDANADVLLELLDSTGKAVFQTTTPTPAYVRLPLYTGQTPLTLLPPGTYSLTGSILQGATTLATSTIMVQIQ